MKKAEIAKQITERMIARIKEIGSLPWAKPWAAMGGQFPSNFKSKKAYKGSNCYLAFTGYDSNFFLTFRQIKELGGSVKKGQKSYPIVFWNSKKVEDKETGEKKEIWFARSYRVFNLEQTDGIEYELAETAPVNPDFKPIEEAQEIINNFKDCPEIIEAGAEAYYVPSEDIITVPKAKNFYSDAEYYHTLFHEMAHSTGHANRLNRDTLESRAAFGTQVYSREELTAELCASFLSSKAGFVDLVFDNSAAYLKGWLKKLKSDPLMLIEASKAAGEAFEYITK